MDNESISPSPRISPLMSIGAPTRLGLVVFGALLGGSLWRIRGENGWGAMWGLLAVGAVYTLFIFSLYGNRRKLSPAALGVTAVVFMFTPPSWGTLNAQLTGVIFDIIAPDIVLTINPLSGVFFMLCMGFATPVLFACLLGRAFSGREYRLRDTVLIMAIYFAVVYLMRFTLAPLVVNLVQPQAAELFETGLHSAGIDDGAFAGYIKYIFNEDGIRAFIGGRNYSACVTAVAKAMASAAVLLTLRFGFCDNFAAKSVALVCSAFAFSIVASDVFIFIQFGGYLRQQFAVQQQFPGWNLWEYFTGFLAFLIITAVFTSRRFAREVEKSDPPNEFSFGNRRWLSGIFCFLFFCIATMSASVIRPALKRFETSEVTISFSNIIIAAVLAFWFLFCIRYGFTIDKIVCRDRFYAISMCAIQAVYLALYFCVLEPNERFLDMTNPVNVIMLISSVASVALVPLVLTVNKRTSSRRLSAV